jgi:hypothetical protein
LQPVVRTITTCCVIADGDRRCRVVWITDLLPDTIAELVEGFMEQGGAALKRTLEARDVDAEDVKKRTRRPDDRLVEGAFTAY